MPNDERNPNDQVRMSPDRGAQSRKKFRAELILRTTIWRLAGLVLIINGQASTAQDRLDRVEDNLNLKSRNGWFRSDLTVLLDLEGYYVDQRAPGLLYANQSFINPRATFFVDTKLGEQFYSLVQARLDRGFDAGDGAFDARMDEYLLRWTPGADGRLNLQFGKFATVVGSWVQRHDTWQNPLITAPLP